MTRLEAWEIVKEFVKNENLQKHMLAVEAAMAAYATKWGEDQERYRVAGLLHDFDWEIHPSIPDHPQKGASILRKRGVDEAMVQTILSHARHTGVKREKLIDKTLFACDEITGLIVAVTLVRPTKKIKDVEVKAVQKKFKEKSFAAGVNREEVIEGAEALNVNLWTEHVPLVLSAMQSISATLGF